MREETPPPAQRYGVVRAVVGAAGDLHCGVPGDDRLDRGDQPAGALVRPPLAGAAGGYGALKAVMPEDMVAASSRPLSVKIDCPKLLPLPTDRVLSSLPVLASSRNGPVFPP